MILFIDNKQTPSDGFRTPRYVLFSEVLRKEGYTTQLILGSWHHGLKKRIVNESDSIHLIKSISYQKHIGVKRFLSEFLFGYQVIFQHLALVKKARLIVLNDSSLFYNYLFIFFKPFFKYKILLDSNDLWPEIFVKNKKVRKILFIFKRIIYSKADYFIAVNKEYLDDYDYLKSKNLGVIDLGLTLERNKDIKCNLFNKNSRPFLYLGSLGVNYKIEDICQFIFDNEGYELDCYGSGSKANIVKEFELKSKGRIRLFDPKSLEYFKKLGNQYCFGLALYSADSLVKFPTKLFDYWAFSLPIIVNVGEDVDKRLNDNPELGYFLKNNEDLNKKLIDDYLEKYNQVINENEFTIDARVLGVFSKINDLMLGELKHDLIN